jgi:hypothetical protein
VGLPEAMVVEIVMENFFVEIRELPFIIDRFRTSLQLFQHVYRECHV